VIRHISSDLLVGGSLSLLQEEGKPALSEVAMPTTTDSRILTAITATCHKRDRNRRRSRTSSSADRQWMKGRRWQWEQRRLPSASDTDLALPKRHPAR
jgi:hypothetical protein